MSTISVSSEHIDKVIPLTQRTAFEPATPAYIKRSIFFVGSVGMREVPERLVTELFREVFFDPYRPSGSPHARELAPDVEMSLPEQALLHLGRGREKQNSGRASYYGPLYPLLARNSWSRKQAERVIDGQLLRGPIAQYVSDHKLSVITIAKILTSALHGNSRSGRVEDVFGAALAQVEHDVSDASLLPPSAAAEMLARRIDIRRSELLNTDLPDPLANRIGEDFVNLCRLEGTIPRLLWIDLLKSFLRIALPTWVLAQMRMTVNLRDWALTGMSGVPVSDETIRNSLRNRYRDLYHPLQTASNEVALHIETYVKARVELSVISYLLFGNHDGMEKRVLAPDSSDREHLSVAEWVTKCGFAAAAKNIAGDEKRIRSLVVGYAQNFGAWLNPPKKGQGKNIEEFLRSLLRLSIADDDDGYLVTSISGGRGGSFERAVVFPGPSTIKLMMCLAAQAKESKAPQLRGKLVLAELEEHFSAYGVEFGASAGARPQLIRELSRLGLLRGSPDAGESAELITPI